MEQRYFSISEVCQRFGVSRRTVNRWIASGQLPTYKLGRLVRISPDDLRAFEEARKA